MEEEKPKSTNKPFVLTKKTKEESSNMRMGILIFLSLLVAWEPIRKPAINREVNRPLPKTASADFHAFREQSCFLSCCPSGSSVGSRISRLSSCGLSDMAMAYLGLIMPFELITRCHGTVSPL